MSTPVDALLQVIAIGGRLAPAEPGKITAHLPRGCPGDVKNAVREHKSVLLALLVRNFVVVQSDACGATLFWADSDETKRLLIDAGANAGTIYTPVELQTLVGKRVGCNEIGAIHLAKAWSNGRITEDQ